MRYLSLVLITVLLSSCLKGSKKTAGAIDVLPVQLDGEVWISGKGLNCLDKKVKQKIKDGQFNLTSNLKSILQDCKLKGMKVFSGETYQLTDLKISTVTYVAKTTPTNKEPFQYECNYPVPRLGLKLVTKGNFLVSNQLVKPKKEIDDVITQLINKKNQKKESPILPGVYPFMDKGNSEKLYYVQVDLGMTDVYTLYEYPSSKELKQVSAEPCGS